MSASTLVGLACIRCGGEPGDEHPALGCPNCRAAGVPSALSTVYDLNVARATWSMEELSRRPFGPSRYGELLPPGTGSLALSEGATPLLRAERLARQLGVHSILVKDESRNPTWSFKDRAASVASLRARQEGCRGLVVSSTGNAAAATSAYAAAMDLPVMVLFAQGVDEVLSRFVRSFGGNIVVTRTKSERWVFMRRCVEEFGFYPNSNFADPPVGNDPFALDGYKTIAFEVWDQLGGRAPTGIVTPVGYGDSLFAMYKAFDELKTLGSSEIPRLVAGEMYGSISRTIEEGSQSLVKAEIDGPTVASSIGTAQSTYQALHAIISSRGAVYHLEDEEVLDAQRLLTETEGLFVEAASAAGIAALVRDLRNGTLDPDGDYVFINTSAGIKSVGAVGDIGIEPKVTDDVENFALLVSATLAGVTGGGMR